MQQMIHDLAIELLFAIELVNFLLFSINWESKLLNKQVCNKKSFLVRMDRGRFDALFDRIKKAQSGEDRMNVSYAQALREIGFGRKRSKTIPLLYLNVKN